MSKWLMQAGTIVLALFHVIAHANDKPLVYWVYVNEQKPNLIDIKVDTSKLGIFSLEQSRSLKKAESQSEASITCYKPGGKTSVKINFNQQISCQSITWHTELTVLSDFDYNASSQQSIYSPSGWWLLFEWDNFHRLKGIENAKVCIANNKPKSKKEKNIALCSPLPQSDQPPLLLAWGKPSTRINVENLKLTIYADNELLIHEIKTIKESLQKQYSYLQTVFSQPEHMNQVRDWSLIWVGIDKKHKSLGGAAGSEAYISNYLVDKKQLTKQSIPMLLKVSAHETVHSITEYPFPLWISESLAEYYAYKSMQFISYSVNDPLTEWKQKRNVIPHAKTGLYEANLKVSEQHDMSYYPLFYVKGAAFWQALDKALQDKQKTLDTFIPLLSTETTQHKLNNAFIRQVEGIIGSQHWQTLAKDYF
ncbi:hypothetical protein [Zooshikella harenae]|uniref:Peptidase MA-like domain-containing protein n=1 Tax=Zooshikella harenae TaxID=2827238 RepID=A0ABS5ZF19_9GAMM|nr:hypothetical protein [Zooshikella harenae]MBU2712657.1 hypothetical protein [Zooshikella harenae]